MFYPTFCNRKTLIFLTLNWGSISRLKTDLKYHPGLLLKSDFSIQMTFLRGILSLKPKS